MELEIKDKDILRILKFFRIRNQKFRIFVAGVEEFFSRVEKNHSFLVSAGIAFNILLYLIPLLLIAIYLVNIIFDIDSVANFLVTTIKRILPPNNSSTELLNSTIDEVYLILGKSSILGWIGIFTLLWLSSTLFSSLRTGLNNVFNIPTPQIYFIYKIRDIFLTIVVAIFILFSSYVFPVVSVISSLLDKYIPPSLELIFSKIFLTIVSLSTSFVLFYLLFRFVPNKKMPRFVRFMSVGLCVSLIEISRRIFAWYLGGISAYGKFYGTYAILASMALWIYYLILITMLSAEFSQLIYDIRKKEEK